MTDTHSGDAAAEPLDAADAHPSSSVLDAATDAALRADGEGPEPAEPGIHPFSIAFAIGVTVTKWTRLWAERRPETPLAVFRAEPGEQVGVLHGDPTAADVSFVRLPVDQSGLSVIPLYSEVQVVIVPKDHPASVFESVTVADLADEHLLQEPDDVPEWRDAAAEIGDGSRRPLLGIRSLEDAVEQVAAGVGILIVPQSIARLHSRKDIVYRPVTDVAETQIALAWLAENTTADIEEFVGIVRGRSAASSRAASAPGGEQAAPDARPKKIGPVAKAKAKARAAAEAEAASAKRAGVKKPATSTPRKKKQSDAANAAQARRRKFGGKR
ncbi:LysR family transcriptional regulator [Subtercola sp. Z020]|uniref:LysR family substrate-binding domain-containing protein n=1 Tax=Subtercola sp. Z020 TaxID=2080582 RepID=UPI000CE8FDFD|nr:LysR family substrate-binding domain-containing protein [Subtercola sp. Z020]PPF90022.1 LysR family transcriptional regulator [Subtercola sp. Z020]